MIEWIGWLLGQDWNAFAEGSLSFGASLSWLWLLLGVVLAISGITLLYRKTTSPLSQPLRILLIGLRSIILMILLVALFRPMLTTSKVLPQESFLAVLVDDSQSMSLLDEGESETRSHRVQEWLFDSDNTLERLQENFRVRTYRFTDSTQRTLGPDDLTQQGVHTAIGQSLAHVTTELRELPLSGIVLLSDGKDNSNADPLVNAATLKSLNVPVFSIGVGPETVRKDLELVDVQASPTVMEGSIFEIHAFIRHQGFEGREIELNLTTSSNDIRSDSEQPTTETSSTPVPDAETTVVSKTVTLGRGGIPQRYTLEFAPSPGKQVYTLRLPHENDELTTFNNQRSVLVNNEKKEVDLVYIEGHPRHEYKFIQRALQEDEALRLATYLQTGPQKFLRQGILSARELAKGFPKTKEELYQYEAIILGDVPQKFFSSGQMDLIRSFVAERGGGFLMIGGSTAFEDDYIDTPIADILPVTLIRSTRLPAELRKGERQGMSPVGEKFKLLLTAEGERAPFLRMGFQGEMNQELWGKMPMLQSINVTGPAKAGASILAEHPTLRYQNRALPVMASQRYGSGRTMALTTASTWRWQMLLPYDDYSHERFWRQVVRWLTLDAPAPLEISLSQETVHLGNTVEIRARVRNKRYQPVNDATVWLQVTDPSGEIQDVPLQWDIEKAGLYVGRVALQQEGIVTFDVTSTTPSQEYDEASLSVLVTPSIAEYSNPHQDVALLRKLAAASNGKYYPFEDAERLFDDLEQLSNTYTVEIQSDLWDMPLVLMLLFGLLGAEWFLRRLKGLS